MDVKFGPLAPMEKQRSGVSENREWRSIRGFKRGEIIAGWEKLHNGELHNLYYYDDKSSRMRWVRPIARIRYIKRLVYKPEGIGPFGRPGFRCENNIKMEDLRFSQRWL
jgi:hypothetical protein